jgi:hypothetical protein
MPKAFRKEGERWGRGREGEEGERGKGERGGRGREGEGGERGWEFFNPKCGLKVLLYFQPSMKTRKKGWNCKTFLQQ